MRNRRKGFLNRIREGNDGIKRKKWKEVENLGNKNSRLCEVYRR